MFQVQKVSCMIASVPGLKKYGHLDHAMITAWWMFIGMLSWLITWLWYEYNVLHDSCKDFLHNSINLFKLKKNLSSRLSQLFDVKYHYRTLLTNIRENYTVKLPIQQYWTKITSESCRIFFYDHQTTSPILKTASINHKWYGFFVVYDNC